MNTTLTYLTDMTPSLSASVFEGFEKRDIRDMFYDASIQTTKEFVEAAGLPNLHFWVIHWEGDVIGMAYSSNHAHSCCLFHYGIYKKYRGRTAIKACRETLRLIPELRPDLYEGKTLIGMTPAPYTHAVKMAKLCGFKEVGTMPNMLYDAYDERSMDGVLTYFIGGKGDGSSR